MSLQEIARAIAEKQRSPYLPPAAKIQEYFAAYRVLERDMSSEERNPNRRLAGEIIKKIAPEGYVGAVKSV